uniref:Farnesyl pyrophosphate synthase n=1 Tax=Anthonomus grandis TaxID=7044 RepID=Q56CY8_ANTGR|nr:farnesyl diphosphate synthase [Anthonomus grandis]
MFSVKLCRNRSCRELIKNIRRGITKTSTDSNSDAISRAQDHNQMNNFNLEGPSSQYHTNVNNKRWHKQMQFNNLRALSTIQQTIPKPSHSSTLVSKEQSRDFMALFPDLVRELTELGRNPELPDVMRRVARVLQYNVPNGKKNRGLILISAYKMLEDPKNLTPENIKLASVLGWCLEMIHSCFLVLDDIMDNSETRRGSLCWYRQNGIGLSAINDGLILENAVYTLLKMHLRDHPAYVPIIELFHETVSKTTLGQCLDSMCLDSDGKPKLEMFSMSRYTSIVKYKTAYYSFHMPVAVAMYLAGMNDPEQHRQAKTILLEMGEFFQIQDDFLDCFGDPAVTGKKGTDIQEGKCSWLAVVALQRASAAQRKIMEEHYGVDDPNSVAIIKKLYEDLSLPNTYAIYEEESYNIIKTHIQQISKGLRHDLFFSIMEKLYKREC